MRSIFFIINIVLLKNIQQIVSCLIEHKKEKTKTCLLISLRLLVLWRPFYYDFRL